MKLFLSQTRYAEKILERFGMLNSKPVVSPMESQVTKSDIEGEMFETTIYRQAIGCLTYLSVGTRPDISFSVTRLAQFVQRPTTQLWAPVKRVLRYSSRTRTEGICYSGDAPLYPVGYSDSDWGRCKINQTSTSGYAFMMAGGVVSWKSKKQGCVAQSSAEAEYMALAAAVKEAIWFGNIFKFIMSAPDGTEVRIFADNQGATKMAKND